MTLYPMPSIVFFFFLFVGCFIVEERIQVFFFPSILLQRIRHS